MAKARKRRFWTDGEKRMVCAQTLVPGVSVSQVARRYDVNANLVFTWLRDPRFAPGETAEGLPEELETRNNVARSDRLWFDAARRCRDESREPVFPV